MTTETTTVDEPAVPPTDSPELVEPMSPIAGFWRRLLAFVVDGIVVGVVGICVGLVASGTLAGMGGWERLVGFGIALAYAGVLNSRIGRGQTIGKALCAIRVTGLDGAMLSLPRALLRQVVFSTPFFLNGAPVSLEALGSWPGYLLSLAIFGGLFAIAYLFFFNRRNRRSLHDLAVGSVVVRAEPPALAKPIAPVWRVHLVVVAVLAVVALLAPLAGQRLAQTKPFEGLLPLQAAMASEPGVQQASVNVGLNGEYVAVTLKIDDRDVEDEAHARRVAEKVMAVYPRAAKASVIHVSFAYGYDMVIASWWHRANFSFTPDELRTANAN